MVLKMGTGGQGGTEKSSVRNKCKFKEHDDAPTMAVKELSSRVAVHSYIGRQADRLTAPVNKAHQQQFAISASRHHREQPSCFFSAGTPSAA